MATRTIKETTDRSDEQKLRRLIKSKGFLASKQRGRWHILDALGQVCSDPLTLDQAMQWKPDVES